MDQSVVTQLVEHFDHHDPRLGNLAEVVYQEMLARGPVAWSDQWGGFWVVSGYEAAHEAYQRYDLFTTYPTVNVPAGSGRGRPMLPLEVDPPIHGKYRSLLAPVFAPPRIQALEGRIRELCDLLIDGFVDDGECEFLEQFASPLPTMIFSQMMDVPLEDGALLHAYKDTLIHGHADDHDGSVRAQAGADLVAYLKSVLDDRRVRRRDDIISLLIDSEADGEKLTEEELLDITFLLFIAGLDTVTSSLGLHFLYLARHPEQRDQLVRDPSLIPSAVEELLRYESLVLAGRTVTQDCEFYGMPMKAGDRMIINGVSADRDPDYFERGDEVILDRSPNRHIAFAAGPHRCVGSHLARLELRIAYERMHARVPGYRLRDGAEVHRHQTSVAGLDQLPLVWP